MRSQRIPRIMDLTGNLLLTLLLILIICTEVHLTIFKCVQTENCGCSTLQTKFEFGCPFNDPDISFHIEPGYEVTFEYYNKTKWDVDLLPSLKVGDVKYFLFRQCPLPNNFKSIIDKFGITNVQVFRFDCSDFGNRSVSKSLFDGLSGIKMLQMENNNINFIDDDAFDDMVNLTHLMLRSNNIQLSSKLFKNLKNLELLDISENNLTDIPEGIFDNLKNLKTLEMWKNKLKNLSSSSLQNLGNLKSLILRFNNFEELNQDMLVHLTSLKNLDLLANNFAYIPQNFFKQNRNLRQILVSRNSNLTTLPDGLLSNLPFLEEVDFSDNRLEILPENLFQNSPNITIIKLQHNKLEELPMYIFQGLAKLKTLNLSYNQLTFIKAETLFYLSHLVNLDLQGNFLKNITEDMFYSLQDLETINLEKNSIHTLHLEAFQRNPNLKEINLNHNQLTFDEFENKFGHHEISPFNSCLKLEKLCLSHNFISNFNSDWLQTKTYITDIDVSYNRIKTIEYRDLQKVSTGKLTINLSYNMITEVDLREVELIVRAQDKPLDSDFRNEDITTVYLNGNPIKCDCGAYDLVRYVEGSMDAAVKKMIDIVVDNVTCASPTDFEGLSLTNISSKQLTCSWTEFPNIWNSCPEDCSCAIRMWDKSLVYNCAYKNLSKVPEIILPGHDFYTQTEVHLEGNRLKEAPREGMGYENVTKLFLSHNDIGSVKWLPPRIELLELDHNNLTSLEYNILLHLNSSTLAKLTLNNNPWKCDCSSTNLSNFLREHLGLKQFDPKTILCNNSGKFSGKPLVSFNRKDLCPTKLPLILGLSISILVLLLLIAILVALYYRYQQPIKVWLFARGLCLWFVTEDEIDKEKTFDAFISYSQKDEDFVVDKLVPILEDGPHPYKLCLHYRNWVPGEFISTQIANSVENSRRTVVILSKSFLKSIWGKMEFRTAHTQAMSEGRARVIIILYGDIDISSVDKELQAYLKTNTYVKWGDPWFWDKLRYALPHSQKMLQKKTVRNNNIMLSINDKLDLMTAPTTPNAESTPPAVSLDPLLIKGNPLDFVKVPDGTELREVCSA